MTAAENRLVDRSRGSGAILSLLFGGVFTGFSAIWLAVAGFGGGWFPAILGVPFVAVGLWVLGRGVRQLWLRYLFGTPTLFVPSADVLLGDAVSTRFERRGGSQRARRARGQITADLVCRETVRYRRGTDLETVTNDVRRIPARVTMDDRPQAVAGRIAVTVPVDWPPTIELQHNKVQTVVEVLVLAPGLPEDRSTFLVPVRPALRNVREQA